MKLKDITPHNVLNWFQGNFNFFQKGTPKHINEQANYRANRCPECATSSKLKCCGCPVPNAFFAPKKSCKNGLWGPMLSEEEWEDFKIKNNL